MDKLKQMFQGKRGKVFLALAAIVAVIAGYMLMRRKSSGGGGALLDAYPSYQSTTGGASGSDGVSRTEMLSAMGELSRDMSASLKEQQTMTKDIAKNFSDSLANTQTAFSQMFMAYSSGIGEQLEGVRADLLSLAYQKNAGGYQSPVAYDLAPVIDPMNREVYSAANPFSLTGAASTTSVVPYYGVGGVNYSDLTSEGKAKQAADMKRLETDPAYRAAQLKQTEQIIANRKADGIDASAQEKHLAKIVQFEEAAKKAG